MLADANEIILIIFFFVLAQASNKSRNNNNGNYSKKYLKIKYEFDLQNCIVDKAHREFKEMTKMEFSPQELDDAKMKLISEFKKLRAMIAYAMWEQRRCKNENWGPLSISNVDETSVDLLKKDASELNKLEPPMIPSDISNASGYSKFEELMANEDISSLNKLENKNKQLEDLRSKAVMMRKDMFELYEENKRIACMLNESVAVSCPLEPCVNDVSHRLEGTDTNEDYSAQELHQLRTDLKILRTEMDQLKQGGIACHDSDDDDGMQEKISAINSLKMKLECSMAEMKSDIKKMRRND